MATTVSSLTSASNIGTITSPGVGSGLDVNGLVSKLMAVEQQPVTALNTQEANDQAKISAYGTLSSSVASLKTAVDALKDTTLYAKQTATSSDSTILGATANTVAKAGTYSINVVALASAQTLTSQTFPSGSTALTTAGGQLKIEVGTYSGGSFSVGSASAVTVNIAAGSSLQSVRDQINAANAGVTAKLISVDSAGTQFKLSITSNTAGAAGSLRITAQDASGNPLATNNTDLAQLSYDPTKTAGNGNEYAVAAPAQDAHIQVDGVDLYRNSNVIGDAITGVSLTATKTGTASLTVAADTSSLQTAIQSFVTAYNSTVALGRSLSNYDTTTNTAAVLTGDSAARNLLAQLSQAIGLSGPSSNANLKYLSDLGINLQKDGSLQVNTIKLQTNLQYSLSNVTSLFASTDSSLPTKGIAVQMSARLDSILAPQGLLASSVTSLQAMVKSIDTRRTALQSRLVQVEANYRAQFTALDTLIASMQQTSTYLTQQLANLPKTTTG
jgi:flagellar hook-associated protein 2